MTLSIINDEGGVFLLPADFPMADLLLVATSLEKADILVPGFLPPGRGVYDPAVFLYAQHEGIKTHILPDRNVASRFAQLARGHKTFADRQLQTAAGLLAFTHCLEIDFEPSIAFHELAHLSGNDCAHEELGWFRAADSAHPQDMINVALHRTDGVSRSYKPAPIAATDLARPLKRWNRNYILALKILELDFLPMTPVGRVLHLLDWMADEFIFGGPAALLASVYLAPNSPPKKGVFKQKNSPNRDGAIAGVRNAAWDLTQVSDFALRVNKAGNEGKIQYIFASFDVHLRQMTHLLLEVGREEAAEDVMAERLSQWWSHKDAVCIATTIQSHLVRIQTSGLNPKSSSDPEFIQNLILDGESRIRNAALRG